jgi:hypothetical protein
MVLNFFLPDDHPNKDDRISIQIKAKDLKPWTKNDTNVNKNACLKKIASIEPLSPKTVYMWV